MYVADTEDASETEDKKDEEFTGIKDQYNLFLQIYLSSLKS